MPSIIDSSRAFAQFPMACPSPFCKVVMLWERLDESLVLMRRLFNWDILDITCGPTSCALHFARRPLSAAAEQQSVSHP